MNWLVLMIHTSFARVWSWSKWFSGSTAARFQPWLITCPVPHIKEKCCAWNEIPTFTNHGHQWILPVKCKRCDSLCLRDKKYRTADLAFAVVRESICELEISRSKKSKTALLEDEWWHVMIKKFKLGLRCCNQCLKLFRDAIEPKLLRNSSIPQPIGIREKLGKVAIVLDVSAEGDRHIGLRSKQDTWGCLHDEQDDHSGCVRQGQAWTTKAND